MTLGDINGHSLVMAVGLRMCQKKNPTRPGRRFEPPSKIPVRKKKESIRKKPQKKKKIIQKPSRIINEHH